MKPFLKWPGGKYRLSERICSSLSTGRRLIEPFTGSAAIFLNSDYEEYLLADSNPDLINLYNHLVAEGIPFIKSCAALFVPENNCAEVYYELREEFNTTHDTRQRSVLFMYLNRHCYNGLIRYNRKGKFNTPFGRYKKPYFPEKELHYFLQSAGKATFIKAEFTESMKLARPGDVVYCDPPYAPLSDTAYFTEYHTGGFCWESQVLLAETARALADRGIRVVVSNHNTSKISSLYRNAGAKIEKFSVSRLISRDITSRNKVEEILAVFT